MSQSEVPYDETRERIAEEIRKLSRLYMATHEGNQIAVRYMGFVSEGLRIWLVTDERTRKWKHILANPNVALAGPEVQIEGVALLKGHPMDEENSDYIRVFEELRPEHYQIVIRPGRMLQRKATRVIEVIPRRVMYSVFSQTWDLEPDFKPHAFVLDVPNEKAYKMLGTDEEPMAVHENPAYWA